MKHTFDPVREVCELCGLARLEADNGRLECAGAQWAYQPPRTRKTWRRKEIVQ